MATNQESTGDAERLTYLNKGQLREEIAYVVGADPTRYGIDSDRGLCRDDMERIATQLKPADSGLDVRKCQLGKLYEVCCRWAGGEYQPNAGNPWGISRQNLKKIHRAVDGRPPREKVAATDGGRLCDLNLSVEPRGGHDV